VLDELAQPHKLSRRAELLLERLPGLNGRFRMVRAVQVPGEEAREVLEGSEELVAADWGRLAGWWRVGLKRKGNLGK
jgi:hypothetical protein